ncbi:MAG: hypothetical protein GY719_00550 [bacterium]|nr:hypothetical protein [bacterium]
MVGSDKWNPFIGPRPFELGERLYGRDREIAELIDRLRSERIILLHSPSGAGKSSLMQAGLLPALEGSFDIWGPTRVNQESPPDAGEVNRYVASANLGFEAPVPERLRRPAATLAGQSLSEYFAGRPRRKRAPEGVLLIFDQFEEVLTVDPLAVAAKRAFFDHLGDLLRNPRIWALFALREDYLAPLEGGGIELAPDEQGEEREKVTLSYARRVPTHFKNRFRIDLLGLASAREAMVEPARVGGREFPAVDRLVHDLATMKVQLPDGSFREQTGHYVEPVQLQVVCRRLWDAMPADDLSIDAEDLAEFGDVSEALGAYYDDSVERVSDGDVDVERSIREWFAERLITASGIRGQVLMEAETSSGLANERIERLRDSHLVRAEMRAGATWFELAHDRLIEPVRDSNAAWRDAHLSEVQRRASLWEKQDRPPGLLMKGEELTEAERWAHEDATLVTDVEKRFLAASKEAREAAGRERRQTRRIRNLGIASIIVGALALAAGVFAFFQWRKAVERRLLVEDQTRMAIAGSLLEADPLRAGLLLLEVRRPDTVSAAIGTLRETLDTPLAINLVGHGKEVLAVTFSTDGSRVTTASRDGTARVWDTVTGAELDILELAESIQAAAFSAEGTRLATASRSAPPQIWDAGTGAEHATLQGHTGEVVAMAFGPDGSRLATASGGSARIWEAATGAELASLQGHTGEIFAVTFSPDGSRLATGSDDGSARIWDVATGSELARFEGHSGAILAVAFSRDGMRLATASWDRTARIWDVTTRMRIALLTGHSFAVRAVAFSRDDSRLATGSGDATARTWDAATGAEIEILSGHSAPVLATAFSPDGAHLVTASGDMTARIWGGAPGVELAILKGHEGSVRAAAFSPDDSRVVTASWDETARIWDPVSESASLTLEGHDGSVQAASFSPDGSRVVTASWDTTARIWDSASGQQLLTLSGHAAPVVAAAFSHDGSLVVTASGDTTARIWDAESGAEIKVFDGHDDAVLDAVFSRDGTRVLTASEDATARIWDPATGIELVVLSGHTEAVEAADFSPDGVRVATASRDQTARIWDVETGSGLAVLSGHREVILGVAFSPDGSRLVTASADETVRIWDTDTGLELAEFRGHSDRVSDASFNTDGSLVLTASDDKTARIWASSTGLLQARLRAATPRCLDASFRTAALGEPRPVAERHAAACGICVRRFDQILQSAPREGIWKTYTEAWREYRDCLGSDPS